MLKVKNIDAFFGMTQVLRHVSLHVEAGEIVSLIGANGAGKTTLLNVFSGLHPTRNGSRMFCDIETRGLKAEKIVALGLVQVPETDKVFNPLTVLENLELGAFLRRHDGPAQREDMEKIFELFPILRERGDQAAGMLSGGERQMLALGKALMGKPKLLMLDEPSLGLAPLVVESIFGTIQQINQEGVPILLVEQNVPQSLAISEHAFVLEEGSIALSGEGSVLLTNPYIKKLYLGLGEGEA